MTDVFDIGRIGHLLRRDLVRVYRVALIAAAAIVALMIIQAMLQPLMSDRTVVDIIVFAVIAFVGGPIVASKAFAELHDKRQNEAYLLLPASAAEKVVVRLLLVTVLYFVATAILVTAAAWLIYLLEAVAFGRSEVLFMPQAMLDPTLVGAFVVQQSMFLLGAAWFRKQHFLRTGLALTVILIALIWIFVTILRFVIPDIGSLLAGANFNPGPYVEAMTRSYGTVRGIGAAILYVALPVFCWFVAWLRVRETEVSHGV